jgi:hypothetical protein
MVRQNVWQQVSRSVAEFLLLKRRLGVQGLGRAIQLSYGHLPVFCRFRKL